MTVVVFEENLCLKRIEFWVLTCIDVVIDTGSETAPVYPGCAMAWQMVGTVSDAESRKQAVGVVAVVADVFEVVSRCTRTTN